jgi:magnesium chelatase family protein
MFDEYAVVGELALDGSTRSIKGVLSMAMAVAANKKLRGIIVPSANSPESRPSSPFEVSHAVLTISLSSAVMCRFVGSATIGSATSIFSSWTATIRICS